MITRIHRAIYRTWGKPVRLRRKSRGQRRKFFGGSGRRSTW